MRSRIALALAVLAGLILTGCSPGEGDTPSAESSPSMSIEDTMVAYARCMREHGIDMPDPEPGKGVDLSVPDGMDPQVVEAANQECKKFMPNGGEPPKLSAEQLEKNRQYAKCMREHGLPDFPDPDPETGGISLSGRQFDPNDPGFQAADKTCGGPGGTHSEKNG
ncbi:hypothetical protein Afil01_07870 [Actinorhabdospora filicis]|uniref:Secreted protein n=1 Tax=Actinorhabdospora filicis TaxID=1785913 RepID=A0A9W6W8T5_9ACTN|nr:hypothetical protein [Actinorhabdospora filicis]GLZ75980.1 hypothetical protein Afil01_07870 [Actinorhabdospora filicis]